MLNKRQKHLLRWYLQLSQDLPYSDETIKMLKQEEIEEIVKQHFEQDLEALRLLADEVITSAYMYEQAH